jgi:hypothetical protein
MHKVQVQVQVQQQRVVAVVQGLGQEGCCNLLQGQQRSSQLWQPGTSSNSNSSC